MCIAEHISQIPKNPSGVTGRNLGSNSVNQYKYLKVDNPDQIWYALATSNYIQRQLSCEARDASYFTGRS